MLKQHTSGIFPSLDRYMDSTLFSMKQVLNKINTSYEYSNMNIVLFQDESWTEVDTKSSSILEVLLPQDTVVIKRPVREGDKSQPIGENTEQIPSM